MMHGSINIRLTVIQSNKSLFNNKYFNQLYSKTSIMRPTQLLVFFLRTATCFGLNRPPPHGVSKFITFFYLVLNTVLMVW